jgi:hypothetical protein
MTTPQGGHARGVVFAAALLMAGGLCLVGCDDAAKQTTCTPPAGGRCPGPAPIPPVQISADPTERQLSGVFMCGGELTASETSTRVTLVYTASAVSAGAGSCRSVTLDARLSSPIGGRSVIDGTTGEPLLVQSTP